MRLPHILPVRTLALGAAAALVSIGLGLAGVLQPAEQQVLDWLFELRGPRPPAAPIVIVAVDEGSFDELDLSWPFPRALHARLLDRISADRPLVIGIDLLFPEPSARGPQDDRALGDAVARARHVVLGAAASVLVEEVGGVSVVKEDMNLPVPAIRRGAAAVGVLNLPRDADAHVRRAELTVRAGGAPQSGFDAALHRQAAERGLPVAPWPSTGEIVINFRGGPGTFPWIPYHRVLRGEVPPGTFRDKIVLIGPTSEALQDVFPTPFAPGADMPGVEIHANVLDTLIRGDRIRPLPAAGHAVLVALVALGAASVAARLRALGGVAVMAGVTVAVVGVAAAAFAVANVWLPLVALGLGLALGYGASMLDGYVREQRERRQLARFFSPGVLDEIVRRRAPLGSRRRTLTVLVSDIRGFTALSERAEPEQLAEMLREYLTEMTDVIFQHGGTVDKYIGDGLMALFNVPFEDAHHATHAVLAGLELQERALALSTRWQARLGVTLRNGVGINTGEAVVGILGSSQRLEYTAIGDTVNLAFRLEALTKEHDAGVIISASTRAAAAGHLLMRELGVMPGRGERARFYGVLPHDLRKYPRVTLHGAMSVTATAGTRTCVLRAHDVGEGGLAVAGLPPDWPVGALVDIRCAGGRLPQPLHAQVRIAWRRADLAGLTFTGVGPEVTAAIGAVEVERPGG